MSDFSLTRRAMSRAAAIALLAALPVAAYAETPACDTRLDLVRLNNPLSHLAKQLASNAPVTIVAIGSSSTAGAGASSPAANYSIRLAVELRLRFPGHALTVINRGIGGE